MRIRPRSRRPGFTLVELLVAAALCVLIMTVLAFAFQQGMDTMSLMKSTGDLQERLRAAEVVIRDDLSADHLDSDYGPRVGDQRMDKFAAGLTNEWRPPRGGFFRIFQGSASTSEGTDPDGLPSTRATDHILHFTVKRTATNIDKVFRAPVPSNAYPALNTHGLLNMRNSDQEFVSQWAEVIYFLDTQNQTGTTSGTSPLRMYSLYRRVRVMTNTTGSFIEWQGNQPNYPDMSCSPQSRTIPGGMTTVQKALNGPGDITNPNHRLGGIGAGHPSTRTNDTAGNPDRIGGARQALALTGDDLLLTNVLSFEVKAAWSTGSPANPPTQPQPTYQDYDTQVTNPTVSKEHPFYDLPTQSRNNHALLNGQRVFDTWFEDANGNWKNSGNADSVPQLIRVKTLQIKLRIYDPKNSQTRQITIIQDI